MSVFFIKNIKTKSTYASFPLSSMDQTRVTYRNIMHHLMTVSCSPSPGKMDGQTDNPLKVKQPAGHQVQLVASPMDRKITFQMHSIHTQHEGLASQIKHFYSTSIKVLKRECKYVVKGIPENVRQSGCKNFSYRLQVVAEMLQCITAGNLGGEHCISVHVRHQARRCVPTHSAPPRQKKRTTGSTKDPVHPGHKVTHFPEEEEVQLLVVTAVEHYPLVEDKDDQR